MVDSISQIMQVQNVSQVLFIHFNECNEKIIYTECTAQSEQVVVQNKIATVAPQDCNTLSFVIIMCFTVKCYVLHL